MDNLILVLDVLDTIEEQNIDKDLAICTLLTYLDVDKLREVQDIFLMEGNNEND